MYPAVAAGHALKKGVGGRRPEVRDAQAWFARSKRRRENPDLRPLASDIFPVPCPLSPISYSLAPGP